MRKATYRDRKDWLYSDKVQAILTHPSERFILCLLVMEFCNSETLEVCPSKETLREKTGYCKNTILDAYSKFEKNKLLIHVPDDQKKNNYSSKTFRLNLFGNVGPEIVVPKKKDLNAYLQGSLTES